MTKDKTDEYGINGKHAEIGDRYSTAQFKGRVIECLRNMENNHNELKGEFKGYVKDTNKRIDALESIKDKALAIVAIVGGTAGLLASKIELILGFLKGML